MSEAAGSANGPDLRQGIGVAKLDDGAVLRGHVGEAPALLVRRGADVLAIGATCTHYGGHWPRVLLLAIPSAAPGIMPALACAPVRRCVRRR